MLKQFVIDESGATSIEYAILAVAIVVLIAGAVMHLDGKLTDMFTRVLNAFAPAK